MYPRADKSPQSISLTAKIVFDSIVYLRARQRDTRGGRSRIGPIRWYTTLGERINVLERIEGRESIEVPDVIGALAVWIQNHGKNKRDMPRRSLSNISRYASASENMFAWFFRVIRSLKTSPLWVIHVETFRPSPPC